MIGGGYYALTRHWSWEVIGGSAPYAHGVTTVILGKHIDKISLDAKKGIRTLPVLIGEKSARMVVLAFLVAPLALIAVLIGTRYFTPAMALGFLSIPSLVPTFSAFLQPKPLTRPEGFPDGNGGWPLYFAPTAFVYTRSFGMWFLLGLAVETALRILVPGFWR